MIENELKEFKNFKRLYTFEQKEIIEINGKECCEGMPLLDEDEKNIGECEKWINVGYKYSGDHAKLLSNLFPYKFEFRGKELKSIESFFQGIKFPDKNMQNLVFEYSGLDSNHIKSCSDYNWKETGMIYWQGKPIDRYSEVYDDLVDEVYISAIQNPLYRSALKNCTKPIIHTMGAKEKNETVFTRYEFEKQLNCLKDFLKK